MSYVSLCVWMAPTYEENVTEYKVYHCNIPFPVYRDTADSMTFRCVSVWVYIWEFQNTNQPGQNRKQNWNWWKKKITHTHIHTTTIVESSIPITQMIYSLPSVMDMDIILSEMHLKFLFKERLLLFVFFWNKYLLLVISV